MEMSLAQHLRLLSPKNMRKIAAQLFPGSVGLSANKIAEKLLDEEFLADYIKTLNEREMSIISLFVWWEGSGGLPRDRAEYLLFRAGDERPSESLDSVMAKGLVLQEGFSDWGNLFIPGDLADKLSVVLTRNFLPPAVPPDEGITENMFTGGFYEDCLTLLAFAHKNPVELTQKGFIHKRTLGKILDLMRFKESTADIPANLAYPFRFFLLINYCVSIKAISFKDRAVEVHPDAAMQWLKQPPLTRILKTTPFIWDFSVDECPNGWGDALLELIFQMKENCWYGYPELAAAARRIAAPFASGEEPWPERFLEIFLESGLLVEGRSGEGARLVRLGFWSPRETAREFPVLPGEDDAWWIQPNFEVLAPPRLAPTLRWQLEMLADPVKMDHAFIYALTKKATLGFFDRGGNAPDMLDFLEKHSKNPLPQNVLFTIKEWGALYGRVSFWDVFLLRCDTPQLADEIAA
ncbi:MAG TPA: helicase-associated domain-containing protein, partial [Spirochaetia bacterium]|nr:helicase-associated domain-containing protein [Spirochaetia bacterium]